jgi:DNA-binding XRE family transcriptional regulator
VAARTEIPPISGQRIVERRHRLHLEQKDLAEILGVSRQAIYLWEVDANTGHYSLAALVLSWLLELPDDELGKIIKEYFARAKKEGVLRARAWVVAQLIRG